MVAKGHVRKGLPAAVLPRWSRIKASPLGYRLARGVFWSLVAAVASRALQLLTSIVTARVLGREAFGEFGMIQSTVGMFSVFGGFGLGLTATKYVAEFRKTDPAKTGRMVGLSIYVAGMTGGFATVALGCCAPLLASGTLAAPQLRLPLQESAPLLLLGALSGAQTGALAGFEAFRVIARLNFVTGLIALPLSIAAVLAKGLDGAIWALVVSTAVGCLLNQRALRRQMGADMVLRVPRIAAEWRVLWSFSLPAVLSGALVGPVNWVCASILVNAPGGYAELGVYNAANQWFGALLFVPSLLSQALQPVFAERHSQRDFGSVRQVLVGSIQGLALLLIPVTAIACVSAPSLMAWYGADYRAHWPTLAYLLLAAAAFSCQAPVGAFVFGTGRAWLALLFTAGWAAAFVTGTLLWSPLGSEGLAAARLVAYSLNAVWCFGSAFKILGAPTASPPRLS